MTTPPPVCVGQEFVPGQPLRVKNTQAAVWPSFGGCTPLAANGLWTDPTGGLWVDPCDPFMLPQNDVVNTTPQALVLGSTNLSPNAPLVYTNPDCLPKQLMLTTVFRARGTLPVNTWLTFQAAVQIGGITWSARPQVASRYCWSTGTMNYQFSCSVVRIAGVGSLGTLTFARQMNLIHGASSGTATGTNVEWDVSTTAWAFSYPTPLAGP